MGFKQWFEQWLCQELHPSSTLILDNVPIHRKNRIQEIAEVRGHQVLFLPRYSPRQASRGKRARRHYVPLSPLGTRKQSFRSERSPCFNSIEHDFAVMKKRRKYAPEGTSIAQIVKNYSERDNPSILI